MIDLTVSEEQQEIGASVRDVLTKAMPIEVVRKLAADKDRPAVDPALWSRLTELGWLGLGVPEELGGVGLGLPEEATVFVELGRALAAGPFRSGAIAAFVAAGARDEELVQAVISGERRVGLVAGRLAVDAHAGDLALTIGPEGAAVVEVLAVEPVEGVDPGCRFGVPSLGATLAELPGPAVLTRARVLAAAELLGVVEALRDMSASYAQSRTQFGKPIGTFQAVKHRCADMAVAAYAIRAQTFFAAVAAEGGEPDADFQAAGAYVLATRGARQTAADAIQVHGGIGFTWEHDAHLYLKRALLLERLHGDRRGHLRAVLAPTAHEFG
ncbi:acyl-CoA dehydrogenase family protein [Streptomyces sp. NPDC048277]|uniref:acyl-CoA dehydrogenase family protein n=1 Tax=Streptomyces sp. NPDC048277 TaxID=3155027 RepID=UPI0033EB7321